MFLCYIAIYELAQAKKGAYGNYTSFCEIF